MTSRQSTPRRTAFPALLLGASLAALTATTPVHAQQVEITRNAVQRDGGMIENRYFLMLMAQTFDGINEVSHSQQAGFARLRQGDESWVRINYGGGAMVMMRPGRVAVDNFDNTTGSEGALAYDYRTHELRGNRVTSAHHNRYVRPLLGRSPALGSDVQWRVDVTPTQLGHQSAQGNAFAIELRRHYFTHAGRDYVLVHYSAPAFQYRNAAGEAVTHWARGAALADPGFGQIYWNASLQRAVAQPVSGAARPYRFARTFYAMDAQGQPLVDVAAIPQLAPHVAHMYGAEATRPIPRSPGMGVPDQTPLQLAAMLDIMAFSLAENSANQLGETIGGYLFGETGRNTGRAIDYNVAPDDLTRDIAVAYGEGPDKFVAAMSGLANLGGGPGNPITEAEFTRITGLNLADMEELQAQSAALTNRTRQLQAEIATLQRNYATVSQNAVELRRAAGQVIDSPLLGHNYMTLSRAQDAERQAAALLAQMSRLDDELRVNVTMGQRLAAALPALESLQAAAQQSGLLRFARGFTEVLERYRITPVFTVLGGIANISEVSTSARNLGAFDPGAPGDLRLSMDYETPGALRNSLALKAVGVAGNLASGNLMAAAADVMTLATGTFTDFYMAYEAANATEGEEQYAHMQHMVTLSRKANLDHQHFQESLRDARERLDRLGAGIEGLQQEIANRPPSEITDPNWRDPRFDDVTGLPIPSYWEYLKANDPETLRRMGIDPEAPVGGWPGGVRPAPAPPVVQPRQPGGPGYPTAGPRSGDARADAGGSTGAAGAASAEDDPPIPTEVAGNASGNAGQAAAEAGSITDARGNASDATAGAMPDGDAGGIARRATIPALDRPNPFDRPTLTEEGTSPLDVTPLPVTRVRFEPVTFTPVRFEPVTFEPVTWTPPRWVPPTFDAPVPSQIPWTDFNDGLNWPGATRNLAFDYGDMEGKVATSLAPWRDWLRTQNLRELERLALAAGYPNLASALTDATNLINRARDTGFRRWAFDMPAFSGNIGLWASQAQHDLARSQVLLGDLLGQSRDIFSTGGLSDIGISGFDLAYLLRDFGVQDGDVVQVELLQFGRTIFQTQLSLLNVGNSFNQRLNPGVAQLIITAINEGSVSPNTAEIQLQNVVRGDPVQSYSLNTGQTAVLRIEADAEGD